MNAGYIILVIVVLNSLAALWRSVSRRGLILDRYNLSLIAVCIGSGAVYLVVPRWCGFGALALWLFFVALPEILRHRRQTVMLDEQSRYISQGSSTSVAAAFSSPATKAIVVLNVLAFIIELVTGATRDGEKMFELGAAFPPAIIAGEWWRLLTAQYLHFDILHIACNMIGLFSLGPFIEQLLGKVKMVTFYTICGVGGMLLVTLLYYFQFTDRGALLIGASAGVLGLVGLTGGIFARLHLSGRSRVAAKQLRAIFQILILQTIFDFMVPQVSSTAHLGGAATGFFIGVLLKPRFRVLG